MTFLRRLARVRQLLLWLADRVIVLSPRPARIQATFDVPFPHPRTLSSSGVQEVRVAILRELGVEYYGE